MCVFARGIVAGSSSQFGSPVQHFQFKVRTIMYRTKGKLTFGFVVHPFPASSRFEMLLVFSSFSCFCCCSESESNITIGWFVGNVIIACIIIRCERRRPTPREPFITTKTHHLGTPCRSTSPMKAMRITYWIYRISGETCNIFW